MSACSGKQHTISRQRNEQWINVSQTDVLLHILAREAKGGGTASQSKLLTRLDV